MRDYKTIINEGVNYNSKTGKVELNGEAFQFLLKFSGSRAKSESGQKAAVRKLVIKAIKEGLNMGAKSE